MDGFAWCEEEMGPPGSLDIGGGLHRIDSSCRWAFAVHPMGSFHFRDEADAALFKVFFG